MFIYSLKVSIDSDQVSAVQPTDQDKDSDMAAHIKDQENSPESAVQPTEQDKDSDMAAHIKDQENSPESAVQPTDQENASKSAVQPTDQDKAVIDNLKGITTKFYFIIF